MNNIEEKKMDEAKDQSIESKRRSLVKSLIWRVIGIVWTWLGAYLILALIPDKYNKAAIVATLIVVYHHSTRMLMYYLYERIWARIKWGRTGTKLSLKWTILWVAITLVSLAVIFFLILYVSPKIKG